MMSTNGIPRGMEEQRKQFRQELPRQLMLDEALRAVGPAEGQDCLEIGGNSGMLAYFLRRHGGNWTSVVTQPEAAEAVAALGGEACRIKEDGSLPFRKKVFDTIVIFDFLERVSSDAAFVEECHRTLKPDGRLIVLATRIKEWTPLGWIRRALGVSREALGWARPGYTENALFNLLKDGFDVHTMHAYSRFGVELVDAMVTAALRRGEKDGNPARAARVRAVGSVLYRLAFQLDMVLFMTKGHRLVAVAKRRGWRSRVTPVLVDGRSITEAVLSRAAD
jgi:SAM-dependent methyltransferase